MYLALGTYNLGIRKALDTPELKTIIQELLTDAMDKVCEHMCKKSIGCVLKNTKRDQLTKSQLSKFDEEFSKMAPITASVITYLCKSRRTGTGTQVGALVSIVFIYRMKSQTVVFWYVFTKT